MRVMLLILLPVAATARADSVDTEFTRVICYSHRVQYLESLSKGGPSQELQQQITAAKCTWPGASEIRRNFKGPPLEYTTTIGGMALALATTRKPRDPRPIARPRPDDSRSSRGTPDMSMKVSSMPTPVPPPAPEPPPTKAVDVPSVGVVVESRKVADCKGEGWLGVFEDHISQSRPLVVFDGGPPERRSGAVGTVPKLDEIVTYGTRHPANFFKPPVPCFLKDRSCEQVKLTGSFRVVGSMPFYSAGPRGQNRWQLCMVREGEPR